MSRNYPDAKEAYTVPRIRKMKGKGSLAAITCYDASFARIIEETSIQLVLVGDSAANVIYGLDSTLPIGIDEMAMHTRAVAAGLSKALLVADMPFLSYQPSAEVAITNAGKLLQAGAKAVKVEGGGSHIRAIIGKLVEVGIPVMGHLGLTPQSVHRFGGYKLQGRSEQDAEHIFEEAKLLEEAGCFSIVLEKVPAELAKGITETLSVPTIGIGAGPHCDGQILVLYDLLGLDSEFRPRFVRRYAELAEEIKEALNRYTEDVKEGRFPSEEESF
ncbi:3-methyl-2-oxobutanoate hydroxymethyltransferase [candidate division WOR-3 bacterium]|nr:3-methyl-2-oxobutanoate hydroxymethyltransferase [candidate division WOR-3 bacterium]